MSNPSNKSKRPSRLWRKLLIGAVLLLLALGGVIAWLFLFPEEPEITSETSISCADISQCSRNCALECPDGMRKLPCMASCSERCAERGCPEATRRYLDMTSCVRSECLMKCITGPGPDCDTCARDNCAPQREVCLQQTSCSTTETDVPTTP